MESLGLIGLLLLIFNFALSYKGFTDKSFFDKYKFQTDAILIHKEYYRLVSSGFLHLNWLHLIFNMLCLTSFSELLENELGSISFLVIYLVSLVGGNLLALYVHRNHGDYSAIGASGAVCGIIFASIGLYPSIEVGFPFTDFSLKSWLFALIFIGLTLYGIKSNKDSIGHDAHLGGAVIGMITAICLVPSSIKENLEIILLFLVPSLLFISAIIFRPEILMVENLFSQRKNNNYDLDHKYNENRADKQNEVDRILDKIQKKGINSLSKKEKDFLDSN